MPPQSTLFDSAHHFRIDHQTINSIAGNQINNYQVLNVRKDLISRLNPIFDASHTRDRELSPPDSACFPGTREEVITEITTWADAVKAPPRAKEEEKPTVSFLVIYTPTPHIYWLHGFAGCGKSAVSLKIADIYEGSGRLLASYFFFRNAGDRSTMKRFAVTLASQLACALPATVPLIENALLAEPGLLSDRASLTRQLERLVYKPFQAIVEGDLLETALVNGPFIIVIDGLDECEDKRGVKQFIEHLLDFFEKHPSIPLRVLIASRVEQHIRERLETDIVLLGNLDSHSPRKDIETFLRASFQTAAKRDRVIRAYVRARGAWPTTLDMDKLINHIGGSFVLASTIFKFIVQPATEEDPRMPMDRLPLTLEMNGLDGLYFQTLTRSQHLPHFQNIISTIALLRSALPIAGIAALLAIETFEVIRVLLNLQAIIHVPGSDEEGKVTLCHTSLCDFLTSKGRSGCFFVPPTFHLDLSYYCFSSIFERNGGAFAGYGDAYFDDHWVSFADSEACDLLAEIEQFKARQPLLVNQVSYHAFLSSLLFYTLFRPGARHLDDASYLLTECAKQLMLAVEHPDHYVQLWLEKELKYYTYRYIRRKYWNLRNEVQFTEDTYKALQRDLQRASTAIQANFPGTLECQPCSTEVEKKFVFSKAQFRPGISVFNALQWIVARAHFKWEELNIAPCPLLKLSIVGAWSPNAAFSFDDGQLATASESDSD